MLVQPLMRVTGGPSRQIPDLQYATSIMNTEPVERPYIPPFVRRVMKDATEEEIQQAGENLRQ
jgi:hypothetical protein